eukprot:2000543-Pleurochrysis_carterae.AAC.2
MHNFTRLHASLSGARTRAHSACTRVIELVSACVQLGRRASGWPPRDDGGSLPMAFLEAGLCPFPPPSATTRNPIQNITVLVLLAFFLNLFLSYVRLHLRPSLLFRVLRLNRHRFPSAR